MRRLAVALAAASLVVAPARADIPPTQIEAAIGVWHQTGTASWFGAGLDGRRMANGRRFDRMGSSAAHRTLPLGTVVRVTCLRTGRSERVRIEDRGPYVRGRIIDLSEGTAMRLGLRDAGIGPVTVTVEPVTPSRP